MLFVKWLIYIAVCLGFFLWFVIPMTGNIALFLTVFLGVDPAVSVPIGFFVWLAIGPCKKSCVSLEG